MNSPFPHCPSCKSPELKFDGVKQFRCPDCGWEFYQNTAAAVIAVLTHEGRIPCIVRGREPGLGKLDLPGGFVDFLESAEAALEREVFEETGIRVSRFTYLGSGHNVYPYKGITYHSCDLMYHAELEDANTTLCQDEATGITWRLPHEITRDDMAFGSAWQAIQKYAAMRETTSAPHHSPA